MGEPAMPTPAERAETRKLARAIVESVVDDEPMPWPEEDFHRIDVELFVFQLAQEITLLEPSPEPRVLDTGEGRVLVGFTSYELGCILNYIPDHRTMTSIRERCLKALALLDPDAAKEHQ